MVEGGGPLAELVAAYEARLAGVPDAPDDGGVVVAYVGSDVPLAVLDAAGIRAVRICGDPTAASDAADEVAERAIDGMVRSQLARLIDGTYAGAARVLVSHDTEGSARLFHYAAECRHLGIGNVPPIDVVDVLHRPTESSTRYSAEVVADVRRLAGELTGGEVTDDALTRAIARADERRALLDQVAALRRGPSPRLSGVEWLAVVGAAATLGVEEHCRLLRRLLDGADGLERHAGTRVVLTGSDHDHPLVHAALEACGMVVVGEDSGWGQGWFDQPEADPASHGSRNPPDRGRARPNTSDDGADVDLERRLALEHQFGAPRSGRHPIEARARYIASLAADTGAEVALSVLRPGDDGPPWDVPAQRAAFAELGIPLFEVTLAGYSAVHVDAGADAAAAAIERRGAPSAPAPAGRTVLAPAGSPSGTRVPARAATPPPERRAPRPKGLEASAVATAYQRQWFADMREQVAAGTPLAVVNADAPHEILRAMGIPYVVNQWWASVCAAKQQGPRYLGLLRELGYPDDIEAYSAMALGSALDHDPTDAPWGGLPPVDLLVAETTTDATAKIFEVWGAEQGAEVVLLESTVAPLRPRRWFDHIHDDWERVLGPRRIDLMVDEIRQLIARIGERTGRTLDEDELRRVMALANEQAEWNARTRDLIARTSPAPIAVADAIPATMIPQWHRGSEWGRDAARQLYEEVADLAASGTGVVEDERARLMWIGRGLWFDMGFYERVQERHGAVFVWSMYLAVAADAYLRRGDDPIRTLAGRFAGFADLYNTPPWSSEWYAKEAIHNRIDGVVHLTTDAVRGTHFITRAIEAAGVPVLEISGSNVDAREWDAEAVAAAVDGFIDGRVSERATRRRRNEV